MIPKANLKEKEEEKKATNLPRWIAPPTSGIALEFRPVSKTYVPSPWAPGAWSRFCIWG